jgi:hypothetical protein
VARRLGRRYRVLRQVGTRSDADGRRAGAPRTNTRLNVVDRVTGAIEKDGGQTKASLAVRLSHWVRSNMPNKSICSPSKERVCILHLDNEDIRADVRWARLIDVKRMISERQRVAVEHNVAVAHLAPITNHCVEAENTCSITFATWPSLDRLRLQRKRVFDVTRAETERLLQILGAEDKTKIDKHMTYMREVERRLLAMSPAPTPELAAAPAAE